MTQEEKAKRYDEALKAAIVASKDEDRHLKATLERIFPELKESDDEKIRKALIEMVHDTTGDSLWIDYNVHKEDALAWLEKQGEQKSYNKFEPKFKVGDKIRIKTPSLYDKDMQVARIESYYYICNHIGKFSSEVVPFSKESSYELIEQNPAWSEEDKAVLDALIRRLEGKDVYVSPHLAIECLKFLKDRVQSQPKQEWSEEDGKVIKDICDKLNRLSMTIVGNESKVCLDDINWLKSLKPQNRWKPSEEQIKALKEAVDEHFDIDGGALWHLYQELKNLKE